MVDTLETLSLVGAGKYLENLCNSRLAPLRDIAFEELLVLMQPEEEFRFGRLWKGCVSTHVNLLDNQQTVRIVIHGVLEFILLGNYYNYTDGFRKGRDGSFKKLTEMDYLEFD